jgi:hypothetical protein
VCWYVRYTYQHTHVHATESRITAESHVACVTWKSGSYLYSSVGHTDLWFLRVLAARSGTTLWNVWEWHSHCGEYLLPYNSESPGRNVLTLQRTILLPSSIYLHQTARRQSQKTVFCHKMGHELFLSAYITLLSHSSYSRSIDFVVNTESLITSSSIS